MKMTAISARDRDGSPYHRPAADVAVPGPPPALAVPRCSYRVPVELKPVENGPAGFAAGLFVLRAANRGLRLRDERREMLAGEGGSGGDEFSRRALEYDAPSIMPGTRSEIDNPIGMRHDHEPV